MFGLSRKIRDPRERRRLYRIPEKSAMLVLDDVSYAIADWSIDGFRAIGHRGGHEVGDSARARLVIVYKGNPTGFNAKTVIRRADAENQGIAGEFVSMSASARQEIARVYREKLAVFQASEGVKDEVDAQAISRALRLQGLE